MQYDYMLLLMVCLRRAVPCRCVHNFTGKVTEIGAKVTDATKSEAEIINANAVGVAEVMVCQRVGAVEACVIGDRLREHLAAMVTGKVSAKVSAKVSEPLLAGLRETKASGERLWITGAPEEIVGISVGTCAIVKS